MGDNRRPQAKKSAAARRLKQKEDSYMQGNSPSNEQIDHSGRRCEERMKDHEWEGKLDWRSTSNSW